jgi:hypothetical protein
MCGNNWRSYLTHLRNRLHQHHFPPTWQQRILAWYSRKLDPPVPKSWVALFALLAIILQNRASTAGVMVWNIIHIIWMNADGDRSNYAVRSGESGAKCYGSLSGVAFIVVVPKRFVQL